MTPKILATVPLDHLPETCTVLEAAGTVVYTDHPTHEEILPDLQDAEALFTNTMMLLGPSIIDSAPRLRVICTPSTGTDHVDKAYCREKGVDVISITRDYELLRTITSTAEHAFGLMLNVVRNMPWSFDSVREGDWDYTRFRGRELQGRVIGLVGYGRLGTMMSRFANGFDMVVLTTDPHVKVEDPWVEQVDLDELLDRSEIVSLHVHLTPETYHMVDRTWFDRMDGAYLVNTSRGCLIKEADLLEALRDGRVKAAGLDVICGEVGSDTAEHPLVVYSRNHSNVMITPHCGGMSYDGQEKAFAFAARKLSRYLSGLPVELAT